MMASTKFPAGNILPPTHSLMGKTESRCKVTTPRGLFGKCPGIRGGRRSVRSKYFIGSSSQLLSVPYRTSLQSLPEKSPSIRSAEKPESIRTGNTART
ncbi:hypothetical protein AVEN_35575-1 [Araneus ventricosus]|uniref:Uncharacterized protein n=1 Tax=Araneus ventricosus TaxID=182803 RepID=A0A4Y2CJ75_ARAVE|nr:hypothetical protein AVEN_35575-1 [Araneus ventricosus]